MYVYVYWFRHSGPKAKEYACSLSHWDGALVKRQACYKPQSPAFVKCRFPGNQVGEKWVKNEFWCWENKFWPTYFLPILINSVQTRGIVKTSGFTRGVCKKRWFYHIERFLVEFLKNRPKSKKTEIPRKDFGALGVSSRPTASQWCTLSEWCLLCPRRAFWGLSLYSIKKPTPPLSLTPRTPLSPPPSRKKKYININIYISKTSTLPIALRTSHLCSWFRIASGREGLFWGPPTFVDSKTRASKRHINMEHINFLKVGTTLGQPAG